MAARRPPWRRARDTRRATRRAIRATQRRPGRRGERLPRAGRGRATARRRVQPSRSRSPSRRAPSRTGRGGSAPSRSRTRSTRRRPLPPNAVADTPPAGSSGGARGRRSLRPLRTRAGTRDRAGCTGSTRATRARRAAGTTSDPVRGHTSTRETRAHPQHRPARPMAVHRRRARMRRCLRALLSGPPCAGCRAATPRGARLLQRARRSGPRRRASGRALMPGRRPAGLHRALRPPRARSRAARHAARRRHPMRARLRSPSAAGPRLRRGLPADPRSRDRAPAGPRGRRDAGATCARRSRPCRTAARPREQEARESSPEAASVRRAVAGEPAREHRGHRSDRCVRECAARIASGEPARSPSRERRPRARSRQTSGYGRSPRAAVRQPMSPRAPDRSRPVRTGHVEAPPRASRGQPRAGVRPTSERERHLRTRSRHRVLQAGGAARGRRAFRSRDDQFPKLLDGRRPDPGHGVQLLDRPKGPVRVPVVDDLLGGHRTDTGQRVQLLDASPRSG